MLVYENMFIYNFVIITNKQIIKWHILHSLSGVATLKIVLTDHSFVSERLDETPNPKSSSLTDDIEQIDRENKKEKLKEK